MRRSAAGIACLPGVDKVTDKPNREKERKQTHTECIKGADDVARLGPKHILVEAMVLEPVHLGKQTPSKSFDRSFGFAPGTPLLQWKLAMGLVVQWTRLTFSRRFSR